MRPLIGMMPAFYLRFLKIRSRWQDADSTFALGVRFPSMQIPGFYCSRAAAEEAETQAEPFQKSAGERFQAKSRAAAACQVSAQALCLVECGIRCGHQVIR